MNFEDTSTWQGAYQGYGGLAWFYLFNMQTIHTAFIPPHPIFGTAKSKNGLRITVDAPGKKVAMSYTRTSDSRLSYAITVSDHEMLPLADSGTRRRRFVTTGLPVWSPFRIRAGITKESI